MTPEQIAESRAVGMAAQAALVLLGDGPSAETLRAAGVLDCAVVVLAAFHETSTDHERRLYLDGARKQLARA